VRKSAEVRLGDAYLVALGQGELTEKTHIIEALSVKWFRINTLYYIKNKGGRKVKFHPNAAQRQRYVNGHSRNIILKARQLGFTTFEMIDALDDCLFTDNFSAGCICHNLDDAKDIFRNKITFAYRHIPDTWLALFEEIGLRFPRPVSDKGGSGAYVFDNGSSINVSTSYRGGTLQRLHVSEFGKICKQSPSKAQEIVTGAFEAVALGNQITLESTAEGREGYFFDYCANARNLQDLERQLTGLDFKFHFFPWWQEPSYAMDAATVVIPARLHEYFEDLDQKSGIQTTPDQQAWYAKKSEILQDDMQREYPSTPDEAFNQSVEGAYYATQMRFLRTNKRLTTEVHHNPQLPVFTGWDLGMGDSMVIWFAQIVGREVHLIDYLEGEGEGIEYYARELDKKGYHYGGHFGPHDLSVRELGTGVSREDVAKKFGIKFEAVPRISNQAEGVQAVRQFLPACWIDEEACAQGVACLDNYRKEWDDKRGVYKDSPRHDWASHGAKGLETLARADLMARISRQDFAKSRPLGRRGSWAAHT